MLWFVKYGMRIFGYAMVLFASALFLFHFFFYFRVLMPLVIPSLTSSSSSSSVTIDDTINVNDAQAKQQQQMTSKHMMATVFHMLMGLFLGLNMMYNYVQTVRTSPGTVPREWLDQFEESSVEQARNASVSAIRGKSVSKYCGKCRQMKPARAHHCHVCDTCVCRMDHHCPWVNNCVGYKNHRYFLLFLLYLWCCTVYMSLMMVGASWNWIEHSAFVLNEWQVWITFDMVLCGSITLTMSGFLGWHIYLVATNQTTIEFQFNKLRLVMERGTGKVAINEYDVGVKNNLNQIFGFGTRSILWALLPSTRDLPLDGVNYPTLSSLSYGNNYNYSKPEDHMV